MKKVTDFIKSAHGFKLSGCGPAGKETYQRCDFSLIVSSRWSGRYEEFLCFELKKGNNKIFSVSYQVDTEGYMSKPKIYSAEEINADLAKRFEEIGI